ncbi:methyltransferase domain-containing protein [Bradyrhizobium sp. 182]|uniref:class I SAM-dependent methyltransferase n=1 Tax=unclassified Bradyrhizobium TaxID=2631580 RepID=UPI001FFA5B66|nr:MULTISPECIES: methyltransferase domain-containing protein [unclassified Bradyrhizobium]MCK1421348.1 methyltransferase domain-containing protein [Bradyrhizobium sp. CW12]MCK1528226.1 methyltransferase domain-containing protein [Bradyrhizobium sp. 182]MCK1643452.1 methyltransferase domain-containing protein [Bradyrhizobium sp. 154]
MTFNPAESTAVDKTSDRSNVSAHYARSGLTHAIENGVVRMGKAIDTVTIGELAAVDEFHIGGRRATEQLMQQLGIDASDHVLDVGCGLGGPARFVADRYQCRVSGVDLTLDYVETGNRLCEWVGLSDRVKLYQSTALSMPFEQWNFSAAYMLHVGMNIEDKERLCFEVARVLRPGALFAVYDVMRMADGHLSYPLPWATTHECSALGSPESYKRALEHTGFEILSEHNRRDFALAYFEDLRSRASAATDPAPLGLHTLMGDRRQDQIKNMIASISKGVIAPVELFARKAR